MSRDYNNPFALAQEQADILRQHLEPVEQRLRDSMMGAYALGGSDYDTLAETR